MSRDSSPAIDTVAIDLANAAARRNSETRSSEPHHPAPGPATPTAQDSGGPHFPGGNEHLVEGGGIGLAGVGEDALSICPQAEINTFRVGEDLNLIDPGVHGIPGLGAAGPAAQPLQNSNLEIHPIGAHFNAPKQGMGAIDRSSHIAGDGARGG